VPAGGPPGSGKWLISTGGGQFPIWSNMRLYDTGAIWNLDLAPDGKRFAVIPRPETAGEQKGSVHVTFLLNFFDEVRRRIPAGGK
jgi:hypothetical protein